MEQDIPAKRSRIDCNSDSNLITSTPQTRGLSNKPVPRVCRKSPNKGTTHPGTSVLKEMTHLCRLFGPISFLIFIPAPCPLEPSYRGLGFKSTPMKWNAPSRTQHVISSLRWLSQQTRCVFAGIVQHNLMHLQMML